MLPENLTVEPWPRLVKAIEESGGYTHYATLGHLPEPGKEIQLRRFRIEGGDGEEALTDFFDEDEGDEAGEALLKWLCGQVQDHCTGTPKTQLRLRLYGENATKLKTVSLAVYYTDTVSPPGGSEGAERVLEEIALKRAAREEHTQGQFYEQMLHAMRELGELQSNAARDSVALFSGVVHDLSAELKASRSQVNALVEAITNAKIAHAEAAAQTIREQAATVAEDQRSKVAQDLGKQAIEQFGQIVGLLAMKQAGVQMDPALTGILSKLQQNPEFKAAMQNPDVVEMLKDGANVEYIAGWLKDAAAAVKGAEQSNSQGATPPPETGSPFGENAK